MALMAEIVRKMHLSNCEHTTTPFPWKSNQWLANINIPHLREKTILAILSFDSYQPHFLYKVNKNQKCLNPHENNLNKIFHTVCVYVCVCARACVRAHVCALIRSTWQHWTERLTFFCVCVNKCYPMHHTEKKNVLVLCWSMHHMEEKTRIYIYIHY